MMHKVLLSKKADKKRRLLPINIKRLIDDKLDKLEKGEFSDLDIKKLQWYENRYRLRVGKYRILFEKYEDKLIILVIDIWSRGDIYK